MNSPALNRRRFLAHCCTAAAGAGLFGSLLQPALALPAAAHDLVHEALQGLDPAQLWDVHCHLLGNGDSGSGCSLHPSLDQWWRPVEYIRKRAILQGAGIDGDAPSIDRAYVDRLLQLASAFPSGARWLLFAFERAHDEAGLPLAEATTFHVPNRYAAQVAAAHPQRFAWVASVHPYRPDAIAALRRCLDAGAMAVKWLPSSMGIDPLDPRCRPFYDLLAARRVPLIIHCGDEHAVPGMKQQQLGNPLRVRTALAQGVTVIAAHCASLGLAEDLDARSRRRLPAFQLFARLMDEQPGLRGDVSAITQRNRDPEVARTLLRRTDWHARLLQGSDHPLPGLAVLTSLPRLVDAGLLAETDAAPLAALRRANPLLFDLVLKRRLGWQGQRFGSAVFQTRSSFVLSDAVPA
jgi:predicted TIM-barrel fold metal-dependent hydrolase